MGNMISQAKKVFDIESQSILKLKELLTDDFEKIIKKILVSKGKVVITSYYRRESHAV